VTTGLSKHKFFILLLEVIATQSAARASEHSGALVFANGIEYEDSAFAKELLRAPSAMQTRTFFSGKGYRLMPVQI
jgi:vacuolar-type H+-ATPase subunit B/Vma2